MAALGRFDMGASVVSEVRMRHVDRSNAPTPHRGRVRTDLGYRETLTFNAYRASGSVRVDVMHPAEHAASCHVSVVLPPSASFDRRVPFKRLVGTLTVRCDRGPRDSGASRSGAARRVVDGGDALEGEPAAVRKESAEDRVDVTEGGHPDNRVGYSPATRQGDSAQRSFEVAIASPHTDG